MQNDRTPQNQQLAAALDTRTENPRVGSSILSLATIIQRARSAPIVDVSMETALSTRG